MTIVRTAFFEADLTEEQKKDFYQYMEQEVVPIIRQFPNNLGVVLNKPTLAEDEKNKNLMLMMQHSYVDQSVMEQALASDNRLASMKATKVIVEKYNIHVHHVNFIKEEK